MKQNLRNFEVVKTPSYSYDIVISSCNNNNNNDANITSNTNASDNSNNSNYLIQSNYGFYKGNINEKKHKDGKGTFLFSSSTYSGNWVDDRREGEGILIMNYGYSNLGINTCNNNSNSNNVNGNSGSMTYLINDSNKSKFEESFEKIDKYSEDLVNTIQNNNTLKSNFSTKDYYRGKWLNSKANGIGTFHFAKDNSTHEDFWRSGVVIRYVNQNNVFLPIVENGLNLHNKNNDSKEILKEMIEDWKRVIGTDDDFPAPRPYLSSVSTSAYPIGQSSNNTNSNNVNNTGNTVGGANNNSDFDIKSSLLQHSYTQSHITTVTSQPQPLTNATPSNSFTKENGGSSTKSSYGIITANYLKSRIDNEERFFLTLIVFISKWEIPLKNFSNSMVQNVNFLIVVPDVESATFISLSSLIMKSSILEKMVNKLLRDPQIRINMLSEQNQNQLQVGASISTTPENIGSFTTAQPSSTKEERELFKLLPLCLDLDDDTDVQKRNIQSILSILKMFPKQVENTSVVPEFLLQHIGEMISIFKKSKPLESHLLSKQYNNAKNFLLKILNGENPITPPQSQSPLPLSPKDKNNTPSGGPTSPLSSKSVSVTSTESNLSSTSTSNTSCISSSSLSSTTSSSSVNSNNSSSTVSPSKFGKLSKTSSSKDKSKDSSSTLSKTSSSPSKSSNILTSITSIGSSPNKPPQQANNNNNNNNNNPVVAATASKESPKYAKAMDSIKQFNLSKQNLLENIPKPIIPPKPIEINNQHLNILFNLFKSTFEFPNNLSDSIQFLKKINSNIANIRNILSSKINIIKETKSKKADRHSIKVLNKSDNKQDQKILSSYKEYLRDKDLQIDLFLSQLDKEIIILVIGYNVCEEICKLLYSQQILLSLKRLRMAVSFITQLKSHQSKLPKESLIKFIRHIYKIANMLLSSCHPISGGGSYQSMPMISLDETIKESVKSFITSSGELFSMLPLNILPTSSNINPSNSNNISSSPEKSQSPSTFSLNSLFSVFTSSSSTSSSSTTNKSSPNQSNLLNTPPQQPSYMDLSSNQFEPNDISLGPFSFICPLNKIPEEIQSGQYHFILPIASSGDDVLVSILSNSLIDIRTNCSGDKLKQHIQKSNQYFSLLQILFYSLTICVHKSYRIEVLKTITPILIHYTEKDEIFNQYKKSILIEFMEISIKDELFLFSSSFCSFLAQLYKGLSKENKFEFTEIFPIHSFIDLLEKSNKSKSPGSELLRAQSAQVLINLSVSNEKNLIELKRRSSLAIILDLCKLGQIFSHQQIDENELKVLEFLGSGALARVNRGLYNGKEVAIKIFNEGSYSFRLEDFLKEVAIMGLMTHPNLLKLEGACIIPRSGESTFMIVTELMQKGTLWDVIKKSHPLPPNQMIKYALSVAFGLSYLHSFDMIHRDIKAANILVDKDDNAKVGDFGLSRVISTISMTAVAGTPKWESPEILAGEPYSSASDVYSYGMMLFELVSGEEPFAEIQTIVELVKTVYEKKLKPKIPSSCPTNLASLIKECLNNSPKKRPTMDQIILYLQNSSIDESKLKDKDKNKK